MKFLPYLKLMRISALPTCWSNVLTAFWLADVCAVRLNGGLLVQLLFVSSLFYLGGMVLNDVYDTKIDAVERPERPIPSGQISQMVARILGFVLLISGLCYLCFGVWRPGKSPRDFHGLFLFLSIFGYDIGLKRIPIVGAITMGLCRFFNILMVANTVNLPQEIVLYYAVSVFVYITAVTILSGHEAKSLFVRKLVGIGLSSIILIDAVWCLVFVGWIPAIIVLALYPVAMSLRKIVSLT